MLTETLYEAGEVDGVGVVGVTDVAVGCVSKDKKMDWTDLARMSAACSRSRPLSRDPGTSAAMSASSDMMVAVL